MCFQKEADELERLKTVDTYNKFIEKQGIAAVGGMSCGN